MAIEGRCEAGAHVQINPGKHRRDRRSRTFVVVHDDPVGWRGEDFDLAFGNALTYHDPLAASNGHAHFD
jgi:hypothetical protein